MLVMMDDYGDNDDGGDWGRRKRNPERKKSRERKRKRGREKEREKVEERVKEKERNKGKKKQGERRCREDDGKRKYKRNYLLEILLKEREKGKIYIFDFSLLIFHHHHHLVILIYV
uniref:Uncharacterized protein n=1 Tax=Octopus bimaculoides TaxID=37653 RepID=A0A0L8FGP5_OCTBM